MKLEKNLSDIVRSDFSVLTEDEQGMLRGGFGTIIPSGVSDPMVQNNCACSDNNCSCSNNCSVDGDNCNCGSKTTTQVPAGGIGRLVI